MVAPKDPRLLVSEHCPFGDRNMKADIHGVHSQIDRSHLTLPTELEGHSSNGPRTGGRFRPTIRRHRRLLCPFGGPGTPRRVSGLAAFPSGTIELLDPPGFSVPIRVRPAPPMSARVTTHAAHVLRSLSPLPAHFTNVAEAHGWRSPVPERPCLRAAPRNASESGHGHVVCASVPCERRPDSHQRVLTTLRSLLRRKPTYSPP